MKSNLKATPDLAELALRVRNTAEALKKAPADRTRFKIIGSCKGELRAIAALLRQF